MHTVPALVLQTKFRLGYPPDSIQTVVVKPLRRHHVGAINLSRLIFTAGRPHAVDETETGAAAADSAQSPFHFHVDIGHPVLHLSGCIRGEEVRRQPDEINMAIG